MISTFNNVEVAMIIRLNLHGALGKKKELMVFDKGVLGNPIQIILMGNSKRVGK